MGFIAKVMVVLHGALSLTVLGWAGGVFTQRIDWNTPKAAEGKEALPGIYAQQKAKVDEYNVAVDRAHNRWTGNKTTVDLLEAERYPRRAFYQSQLALVQTGSYNGMAQPVPVQELARTANGRYLDISRPTGRPAYFVRPMVPADSVAGYDKKMDELVALIETSHKKNAKAIADREKLNNEIIDTMNPTLVKGLRTLIREQKEFNDRAIAEEVYVTGFVTNREAEFGLLKKRRDAMAERIVELDKAKN